MRSNALWDGLVTYFRAFTALFEDIATSQGNKSEEHENVKSTFFHKRQFDEVKYS